ncbi:hypothetical protein [Helicobacter sp. T3_23-1056]
MSKNKHDIFLFGGFPYKNGSLDTQKMRLYGIVLNATQICAAINILLGFVILEIYFRQNAMLANFYDIVFCVGLCFFAIFCVIFILLFFHFCSFRERKQIKQNLILLTPFCSDKKTKILRFIHIFCILFVCVVFGLLSVLYIGFLVVCALLLATPRIKSVYAQNKELFAEFCILFGAIYIGLYRIKNDESLYCCEYIFSQSIIPIKTQQIVRCERKNNHIIKRRVFGFLKDIDSSVLIDFLNKRAILQDKTNKAQNTKICEKETNFARK